MQTDLVLFEPFISDLVLEEIENNTNSDLKAKMISLISDFGFQILSSNANICELADFYRKEVLKNEINDTIHIALATFYETDSIVSWNF